MANPSKNGFENPSGFYLFYPNRSYHKKKLYFCGHYEKIINKDRAFYTKGD